MEEILKNYPNDSELGNYIRFNYMTIKHIYYPKIITIINTYPNDFDLGEYIRNEYKEGYK